MIDTTTYHGAIMTIFCAIPEPLRFQGNEHFARKIKDKTKREMGTIPPLCHRTLLSDDVYAESEKDGPFAHFDQGV